MKEALTILLLVPFVLGIYAHAEEATINVPFDYNHSSGTLYTFEHHYEYVVKFMGDKVENLIINADENGDLPDCASLGLVFDPENNRCVTVEILADEAYQNYADKVNDNNNPPETISITVIQEESDISVTKYSSVNAGPTGPQCFTDNAATQSFRAYPVETRIVINENGKYVQQVDVKSNPKDRVDRNNTNELEQYLFNQECIGQSKFNALEPHYAHMDTMDIQVSHSDKVTTDVVYSADKLEDMENPIEFNKPSIDCKNHAYPQYVRDHVGCAPTVYEHTGQLAPQMKDYAETSPYQAWLKWNANPDSQLQGIHEKKQYNAIVERTIGGKFP